MTPSNSSSTYEFSEEDMERIKKHVLTSSRQVLVESIDPRPFLTVFRQNYVLNGREYEEIKCACTRSMYEGTEKLLDALMTKGSKGYDNFCSALLQDQTQLHLLQSLQKQLEEYKYNFRRYVEQEQRRKELEANKLKMSSRYSHPTPPPSIVFPPKYHSSQHSSDPPMHRARSPMPTDNQSYPGYYGNPGYTEGIHTDAFYVPQHPDYSIAAQPTGYLPHQSEDYQSQVYLFNCHPPTQFVDSTDVVCGQQGN